MAERNEILPNLEYLCDSITNLESILIQLLQERIISYEDSEIIRAQITSTHKNFQLLTLIQKKDWSVVKPIFIRILRKTLNGHCADRIENYSQSQANQPRNSAANIPRFEITPPVVTVEARSSKIVSSLHPVEQSSLQINANDADTDTGSSEDESGDGDRLLRDFCEHEMLDKGSYGTVLKAKNNEDKIFYAIKVTGIDCHREITALRALNHGNIVKYKNSWMQKSTTVRISSSNLQQLRTLYCIQMEFCGGDNLRAWLNLSKSEKTKKDAQIICFQIANGVYYLHSKNYIHRDIKPENIFLTEPYLQNQSNIVVKIGDFGFTRNPHQASKVLKGLAGSYMSKKTGTVGYDSPEQEADLEKYEFPFSTDIYSLGLVVYEVLLSTFLKTPKVTERRETLKVKASMHPDLATKFDDNVANFTKTMVDTVPANRPTAKSVLDKFVEYGWNQ